MWTIAIWGSFAASTSASQAIRLIVTLAIAVPEVECVASSVVLCVCDASCRGLWECIAVGVALINLVLLACRGAGMDR